MPKALYNRILTGCLPALLIFCIMSPSVIAQNVNEGRNGAVESAGRTLRFIKPHTGKDTTIRVEVADTPETRSQGLMGRDRLGKNNGMLFVYPEEILLRFWMKETLIPLDIIFVSKDYEIIDVIHDVPPCTASPCQIYNSTGKGRYAIEVNAGFSGVHDIKVGDKVDFSVYNRKNK